MAKKPQPKNDLPVYLFTGFLDAGKTRFIQETLEDSRFHKGERTLLLLCEEEAGKREIDNLRIYTDRELLDALE